MKAMGERLRAGLEAQSLAHGFRLVQTGPPQMPLILFADDPDRTLGRAFCREALDRGVYLHHVHTMFLSTAHTPADIDEALEATGGAFAALESMRPTTSLQAVPR
jgi:glutamate-1-semialdehyde 2,1-aminomutase